MTEPELRNLIISKLKDKRPDIDNPDAIANIILSQPYINESTYETFMKAANLA